MQQVRLLTGMGFVCCIWKRIWSDSGLLESGVRFSQLLATEPGQTHLTYSSFATSFLPTVFFFCFHRLYNQLAEVKIRNEEKTRQETYAKNREKAKEFQKVIVCYSILLPLGHMISPSLQSEYLRCSGNGAQTETLKPVWMLSNAIGTSHVRIS